MDQILKEGILLPRGPGNNGRYFCDSHTARQVLHHCALAPAASVVSTQGLNSWSFCLSLWSARLLAIRPSFFWFLPPLSSAVPFALHVLLCSSGTSRFGWLQTMCYWHIALCPNALLQYFTGLAHRWLLAFQMRSCATSLERFSSYTLSKSHHVLSLSCHCHSWTGVSLSLFLFSS